MVFLHTVLCNTWSHTEVQSIEIILFMFTGVFFNNPTYSLLSATFAPKVQKKNDKKKRDLCMCNHYGNLVHTQLKSIILPSKSKNNKKNHSTYHQEPYFKVIASFCMYNASW